MSENHEVLSFIEGKAVSSDGELVVNGNPSDPTTPVSSFRYISAEMMEAAIAAGDRAATTWRQIPIHQRAAILRRAAVLLEQRTEEIALDIAHEQGKTLAVCRGEVARAAAVLVYFAHEANRSSGSMYTSPRAGERIFTDRVPLGQILCITPWNVPLAIPAWKIAPALVHGNTVLWKPSRVTPRVASRLLEALVDAGLPEGVLNFVLARGAEAEGALCDSRVAACTFTGSTAVGRHLVAVGASVGKDVLAEMGGKNSAIVLEDADLDWAADQVVAASMGWTGQRCTATSRVIVEESVCEEFRTLLLGKVAALKAGDPLHPDSDLGPVSSGDQYSSIAQLISDGVAQGARVLAGGVPTRAEDDGYFIAPTVVTDVGEDNILFTDEIFGPVAVLVPAADAQEALRLANGGEYGLSGSLYTSRIDSVLDMLDHFDVGVLHVNSESTGADPHVPFGGFGASGTHHKEMGEEAREFYTRLRTVYLRGGRP